MFNIVNPNVNINFTGKRNLWFAISLATVVGSLVLFFTKGLNYGIDFTGGAEVQVTLPSDWDLARVRKSMTDAGLGSVGVRSMGQENQNDYMIRLPGTEEELNKITTQVAGVFQKELNVSSSESFLLKSDIVGPAAGSTLRKNGILAFFYVMLAILIYLAFRFDSRYAPGAVVALMHDAIIVLGVFILLGKEFDLSILASILALMGYSLNDTIVVYDRVREVQELHPEYEVEKAVNLAMNETLSRTIMTGLTTLFVVFTLWMWGGAVIENFAFALLIGIIVGTYSSIFIASSLLITLTRYWHNKEIKRKKKGTSSSSFLSPSA